MNSTLRAVALGAAIVFLTGASASAQAVEVLTEDPAVMVEEAAEAVQIEIVNTQYGDPEITIPAGTVVTWTNSDPTPHNVEFTELDIEGPLLRASQSYSVRFNEPGTYDYICTPHPFMTGTVIVE